MNAADCWTRRAIWSKSTCPKIPNTTSQPIGWGRARWACRMWCCHLRGRAVFKVTLLAGVSSEARAGRTVNRGVHFVGPGLRPEQQQNRSPRYARLLRGRVTKTRCDRRVNTARPPSGRRRTTRGVDCTTTIRRPGSTGRHPRANANTPCGSRSSRRFQWSRIPVQMSHAVESDFPAG